MVKMRLRKQGKKRQASYRIVVCDARKSRDGTYIEQIGSYHPLIKNGENSNIDAERARYWLSKGTKPTDTVKRILNKNNIYLKRK